MNLYIDTSALIKLYHYENGSTELENFINKHLDSKGEVVITISEVTIIEFYSVFLKSLRKNEISYKEIQNLFNAFKKHLLFFNVIEINKTIRDIAVELLLKYGRKNALYTLDSIQLASAIFANQVFPIDYFITSDKILINIARFYMNIYNPEK